MRFDVITLFPELFAPFLASGITRRAYTSGLVDVRLWNPRDYAEGNYRRVDDRPFGGGPGMVMMAPPLERCLAAIRTDRAEAVEQTVLVLAFEEDGKPQERMIPFVSAFVDKVELPERRITVDWQPDY